MVEVRGVGGMEEWSGEVREDKQYSTTPTLHYSITPLLHYFNFSARIVTNFKTPG
jgi:hypothetical protein